MKPTDCRSFESLSAAADRTVISTQTLRRRIACGRLVAYRTGRLIRVDPDHVDHLLARIPTARPTQCGGYS
jgi:excisionase family DNA binding protein